MQIEQRETLGRATDSTRQGLQREKRVFRINCSEVTMSIEGSSVDVCCGVVVVVWLCCVAGDDEMGG